MLGHITTFGGNALIAAAALATLEELQNSDLIEAIPGKEALFRERLQHPLIHEIRGKGLMLALIMRDKELAHEMVHQCAREGLILFFLLYEQRAVRLSPPLTISKDEIDKGCQIILKVLSKIRQ